MLLHYGWGDNPNTTQNCALRQTYIPALCVIVAPNLIVRVLDLMLEA
jgi:hypothetical protein